MIRSCGETWSPMISPQTRSWKLGIHLALSIVLGRIFSLNNFTKNGVNFQLIFLRPKISLFVFYLKFFVILYDLVWFILFLRHIQYVVIPVIWSDEVLYSFRRKGLSLEAIFNHWNVKRLNIVDSFDWIPWIAWESRSHKAILNDSVSRVKHFALYHFTMLNKLWHYLAC